MITIDKHKRIRILPFVIILLGISAFILINLVIVDLIEANNSTSSEEVNKSFDMIPFYWTVGIVGGCIALTLAYVSWRKYKDEKKKQLKKNSNG